MSDITKTINFTVTAIQGKSVSNATPNDGDTLVWSSADGYYKLTQPTSSSGGLRKDYFTEDGYWTCPEGVTTVILSGSGGGSGGLNGGNYNEFGAAYGGASGFAGEYNSYPVNVVPGTVYSIMIGLGGLPDTSLSSQSIGGTTLFGNLFKARGQQPLPGAAIMSPNNIFNLVNQIGCFSAGNIEGNNSDGYGVGGQAGTNGNGGNGSGLNQPGSNAPANSGGGGGGGGGNNDDSGDGSGFAGGNGGSGYLYIIY